MIEELLCVFSGFRLAAQANAFCNRAVDQIFFRSCGKCFVQRNLSSLLIDFLQPEIALQPAPADWSFAQPQRRVALRKLRIVEITILTQARDDFIDVGLCRAPTLRQTLAQLGHRSGFCGEQPGGALKYALAGFRGIEWRLFFLARFWFSSVTSVVDNSLFNHRGHGGNRDNRNSKI